jgi:hypothetical protein
VIEMSEQETRRIRELQRLLKVLDRLRTLAQEADMTGAFRRGAPYAIQQYNAILASLGEYGVTLPSYYPPIVAEEANMSSVGLAAAQLTEYLKDVLEEAGYPPADPAAGGSGGGIFNQMFSGKEFEHIGEAIREAMPDWLQRGGRGAARPAAPGQAPASPSPPAGPPAGEQSRRMAELATRIQAITQEMQRPGLSPEELQRLAGELSRLGEEQVRIAAGTAAPGPAAPEI